MYDTQERRVTMRVVLVSLLSYYVVGLVIMYKSVSSRDRR